MADQKISQLTAATTPLAGTEVLPIVQSSTTKKVSVSDLTAGRAVSAAQLDVDNVRVDGNTISTTNTNGSLTLTPNGTGLVVSSSDMTVNSLTFGRGKVGDINSVILGSNAGQSLQTGAVQNTNVGAFAAYSTTTGKRQTAVGYSALYYNTTGEINTAVGSSCMLGNTTGGYNAAVGDYALNANTNGYYNAALGVYAGTAAVSGNNNSFFGYGAGSTLTSGDNNTCIGSFAQPSAASVSNEYTYGDANVTVHRFTGGNISLVAANASLRFTGNGGVIWRTGAGTPEGAVTAPVGSLFTRTDGGANTTLYVKESGTGNTGWVAK